MSGVVHIVTWARDVKIAVDSEVGTACSGGDKKSLGLADLPKEVSVHVRHEVSTMTCFRNFENVTGSEFAGFDSLSWHILENCH